MTTAISIRFTGSSTLTGTLTVSDANASRILAAEKTYSGSADNQATLDYLIRRFLDEMIADTKSVERATLSVSDIPVT
jgi:hypothetical protein